MDSRIKDLQEFLAHQTWEAYRVHVLTVLKEQIQRNLQAETRRGDAIKAAQYVGQLDILEVILDIPNKELKKLKG